MTQTSRDQDLPITAKPNGLFARLKARLRIGGSSSTLRESLIDVLDEHGAEQGNAKEATDHLTEQERSMLRNILEFGSLRVEDVMVPRADIVAVEQDESLEELLQVLAEAGHSRMPVYRETLDDPIGMYHIKDLLPVVFQLIKDDASEKSSQLLAKQRRDALFVPPSMAALDLFLKMQTTRIHMALVIDEYGGTDGLVTIEDLVEEIVGEIEDEHDTEEGPLLSMIEEGLYMADARAEMDDVIEIFGADIYGDADEEDIDTLGGLIFDLIGRVPHRGELITHPAGLEFEIIDADPRRIKKVRIKMIKAKTTNAEAPASKPAKEISEAS